MNLKSRFMKNQPNSEIRLSVAINLTPGDIPRGPTVILKLNYTLNSLPGILWFFCRRQVLIKGHLAAPETQSLIPCWLRAWTHSFVIVLHFGFRLKVGEMEYNDCFFPMVVFLFLVFFFHYKSDRWLLKMWRIYRKKWKCKSILSAVHLPSCGIVKASVFSFQSYFLHWRDFSNLVKITQDRWLCSLNSHLILCHTHFPDKHLFLNFQFENFKRQE